MKTGIIIGAGRAGTYLHYGALIKAGARIAAIVDQNEALAKEACSRFGIESFYTDTETALDRCPEAEFVDICTFPSTHGSLWLGIRRS